MTTMNIHICMYIIIIPFRNEVKASYNRIQPSSAHSYIHYSTATIIIENTSELGLAINVKEQRLFTVFAIYAVTFKSFFGFCVEDNN